MVDTPRLLLRQWTDADVEPFARLGADPEVMRYFPATMSRAESAALVDRMRQRIDRDGWGLWAVEVRDGGPLDGRMIGFTGLVLQTFAAHFTPAVEIGWRLSRDAWGHGYASEAARAVLAEGFGPIGLDEIVSMAAVENTRSRAVMERIGMHRAAHDDFEHPALMHGHPLRRHVLYRIAAPHSG